MLPKFYFTRRRERRKAQAKDAEITKEDSSSREKFGVGEYAGTRIGSYV